jgi:quercetin dioxygenase-like cupin family protein
MVSLRGDTVSAQEPPPQIRFTTVASHNYTDFSPRQYDLVQALVELAPGAAVPSHRVNGRAIITVLAGEVTRIEEGGETAVFKAGQTFPESSGDHLDVDANKGTVPARFLATFLLEPGAEPLIFAPGDSPTGPGPTFVAVARRPIYTMGTIPAHFTLVHGMFEVPTGFKVGLHTHDGWSVVTELSGGHVTNRVNGVVQTGATFVHGPFDVHDGENTGGTVTAMFASVGPTGAPPSRPLTATLRPPSTGDGGLLAGE